MEANSLKMKKLKLLFQGQMDRHSLQHKEDREGTRVYMCKQCNAQFGTRPELKEHTQQHFKIKYV